MTLASLLAWLPGASVPGGLDLAKYLVKYEASCSPLSISRHSHSEARIKFSYFNG